MTKKNNDPKKWEKAWETLGTSINDSGRELTKTKIKKKVKDLDLPESQEGGNTGHQKVLAMEALLNTGNAGAAEGVTEGAKAEATRDEILDIYDDIREISFTDSETDKAACNVLDLLNNFSEDVFDLFSQVLYQKSSSEKYTPNYIMATLLRQASTDLFLLQQVRYQHSSKDQQGKALYFATALAELALKPALDAGYFDTTDTRVFTFMSDKVSIRLLPYCNAVLIGVPAYSVARLEKQPTIPTEYLAVPHEIGHHIYRHGRVNGDPIQYVVYERLKQLLDKEPRDQWWYPWLEEIFADAYGCLIAGPISVFGFQNYLGDRRPPSPNEQIEEHPFAVLRPLIQTRILRKIYSDEGVLADLDTRWAATVKEQWNKWVSKTAWDEKEDNARNDIKKAKYRVTVGDNSKGDFQAGDVVVTKEDKVRLRKDAGLKKEIIEEVPASTRLIVQSSDCKKACGLTWWHVQKEDGEKSDKGWMAQSDGPLLVLAEGYGAGDKTVEAILTELDEVLDAVISSLNALNPKNGDSGNNCDSRWWAPNWAGTGDLSQWSEGFMSRVWAKVILHVAERVSADGRQVTEKDTLSNAQKTYKNALKTAGSDAKKKKEAFDAMVDSILFQGWSNEGPDHGGDD